MHLLVVALLAQQPTAVPSDFLKRAHTYSIVAYDSATGDLGVAVQSKFPNVGGIVPWARAGVGAVATQSLGNTAYGAQGLELMARGASAPEALRIVMRGDTRRAQRQVGMVDAHGNAASWTGDSCFDWAGGRTLTPGGDIVAAGKGQVIVGRGFAAQANIMVSDQTVKNMADAYLRATGPLADRLMIDAAVILLFLDDRLPWAALVAVVARDALLIGGARVVIPRGYEFSVSFLGKLATWLLYAAVGFVLVTHKGDHWPLLVFWTGLGVAVAAALVYIASAWRAIRT